MRTPRSALGAQAHPQGKLGYTRLGEARNRLTCQSTGLWSGYGGTRRSSLRYGIDFLANRSKCGNWSTIADPLSSCIGQCPLRKTAALVHGRWMGPLREKSLLCQFEKRLGMGTPPRGGHTQARLLNMKESRFLMGGWMGPAIYCRGTAHTSENQSRRGQCVERSRDKV